MKAIQTGVGVAFVRAVGMLYPKEKRLFEDPYSEKLLIIPFFKILLALMRSPKRRDRIIKSRDKAYRGEFGWILSRTRYIDDVLKNIITKKSLNDFIFPIISTLYGRFAKVIPATKAPIAIEYPII